MAPAGVLVSLRALALVSECFSLTSFGYHIKSKHDVFSDVTQQKCLRFSHVPFWDGTTTESSDGKWQKSARQF